MELLHAGLDIGSTTAKAVVLDQYDRIVFYRYSRHFADIRTAVERLVGDIKESFSGARLTLAMAGSGALEIARGMNVPFTQEQIACSASIARFLPGVDVCIELGGEDAKITFFDAAGAEQRMNETCAGGTGAFLDQMATLFGTDAAGLNEMAKGYKTLYPVASRCGVFAKTDVQALLNDGAPRSDVAASIFQAIVNQTIGGLACGRSITGRVAFLGGPLYFLSELRKRFSETLRLSPERCIFPENPHLFVAMGAAISAKKFGAEAADVFKRRAERFFISHGDDKRAALPPLFGETAELSSFRERHSRCAVRRAELADYRGAAYLGVDVGSTTTKAALIGSEGELLFSRYKMTGVGEPLKTVREVLSELYSMLPEGVYIAGSGVTGYGEKLIRAAFAMDCGEVETVAHARAAAFVLPGADFVIDIGGQDMKCLRIRNGVIDGVFLNEACSSGCGSFLQSFAGSLNMDMDEFARAAERSASPVDLGSRCTVFMNSRVRQAQKEGAAIEDISAGLVYAVVKNALYKVLKIKDPSELGERIVVQGGAFRNDALLRAFELVTGREVVRPDISELMGAFGAALIARERASAGGSTLAGARELENFSASASTRNCCGCGNRCLLTLTRFSDGRSYISGNRCERGASDSENGERLPDLFERKYRRLFDYYRPRCAKEAPRGVVGIPRVLNIYEDYPFWFTLLTELGFRVELSSASPDEKLGIETVPSQTVCYPAKLAHRHIAELLERGIKNIFYPILLRERKEFDAARNNYNCPVVTGYPDVARLNMEALRGGETRYMTPELAIESDGSVVRAMGKTLAPFGVKRGEIVRALARARSEMESYKADVESFGREALERLRESGGIGVVLAGHPYHLSPEVNHGIPELINSYGVTVFTEDSICALARGLEREGDVESVDQWVYHSRLYRAAIALARHPALKNVELVQLNSFGCGLDAVSAEQTAEILTRAGKLHTLIKIDEGKNNGAVKIRIRSLLAAMKMKKEDCGAPRGDGTQSARRPAVSERRGRTLLCPPLSQFHFQFMETAFSAADINLKVLPEGGRETAELGLRYVNNDLCYPAMMVVGQFIEALRSGLYDPERTDCLYAQTGGACRASNYVHLLRRALDAAGFRQVRLLALNSQGGGEAESFKVPPRIGRRALLGMLYGDLMMRLLLRSRPYEKEKGASESLYESWKKRAEENVRDGRLGSFRENARLMVRDFAALPLDPTPRPRVGIVGEILVKYHANANDRLIELIEDEGGEAVVPDMANFLAYCLFDKVHAHKKLAGALLPRLAGEAGIWLLERLRAPLFSALDGTRFGRPHSIKELSRLGASVVSQSNQAGEGWLLTAEMLALIESGVKNVLCVQPFACLPNHITGKGVVKELKRRCGEANILPLDYDASVSAANRLNRIKLLMATARA
ncbi:MAG: acyl-CoA dehydratase activase [Synergistaceae bacterium]|nr:acyl-CoA dehydratase activase [Synergistaceae bacterium]